MPTPSDLTKTNVLPSPYMPINTKYVYRNIDISPTPTPTNYNQIHKMSKYRNNLNTPIKELSDPKPTNNIDDDNIMFSCWNSSFP